MCSRRLSFPIVFTTTLLIGCSGEPKGGPRVETFPVSGTVLVDGAPAAGVLVACYPQGDGEVKHRLAVHTNDKGEFSLGTYEAGDGLPKGEYKFTFEWIEGTMLGPESDKLKGKYADPEKSEITLTVGGDQENGLGEVKLATK